MQKKKEISTVTQYNIYNIFYSVISYFAFLLTTKNQLVSYDVLTELMILSFEVEKLENPAYQPSGDILRH